MQNVGSCNQAAAPIFGTYCKRISKEIVWRSSFLHFIKTIKNDCRSQFLILMNRPTSTQNPFHFRLLFLVTNKIRGGRGGSGGCSRSSGLAKAGGRVAAASVGRRVRLGTIELLLLLLLLPQKHVKLGYKRQGRLCGWWSNISALIHRTLHPVTIHKGHKREFKATVAHLMLWNSFGLTKRFTYYHVSYYPMST